MKPSTYLLCCLLLAVSSFNHHDKQHKLGLCLGGGVATTKSMPSVPEASSSSSSSRRHSTGAAPAPVSYEQVHTLRQKGLDFISKKNYQQAAKYYLASLQLMEGVGGSETAHLRRRCALTLAECEIKTGHLHDAITTCSTIIDESPDIKSRNDRDSDSHRLTEYEQIKKALGKAYYRRGLSLKKLNQWDMALLDFQDAQYYLPEDAKVKENIDEIEEALRECEMNEESDGGLDSNHIGLAASLGEGGETKMKPTAVNDSDDTAADANVDVSVGENIGNSLSSSSSLPVPSHSSKYSKHDQERFQEYLEELILNYPKTKFTASQIRLMAAQSTSPSVALRRVSGRSLSTSSGILSPDMLGSGATSGGLGDMLGAMGGGLGGLGGLGGIGGLLGAMGGDGLGSLMKGFTLENNFGLDGLEGMAPLVSSLTGLDSQLVTKAGEVLKAMVQAFKGFMSVYQSIARNREALVLALTVAWLLAVTLQAFAPSLYSRGTSKTN